MQAAIPLWTSEGINVNGEIGTPMSDLIEICFLSLSNNKNMVNK